MSTGASILFGLVVVAVVFVGIVIVLGLVFVRVGRRVHGFLGGVAGMNGQRRIPTLSTRNTLRCPESRCHAENPVSARFCRRCGAAMNGRMVARRPAVTRRAAMW
jgi:ribosomal protein L40E